MTLQYKQIIIIIRRELSKDAHSMNTANISILSSGSTIDIKESNIESAESCQMYECGASVFNMW